MKDAPASIQVGDLLAAMDVIDRLGEESDELPLADALVALEALGQLASVLKRTTSLVETQAYRMLEQPMILGERRYKRGNTYTKRFDHQRIARMVADHVKVDRETGELRDATTAVARALHLFIEIYLSDSTKAKQTALKDYLGVADAEEENLATEVITGHCIRAFDLKENET